MNFLKEKCGVVGVSLKNRGTDQAALITYYALYALQHRGQESTGIATYDDKIYIDRGMGLVSDVFNKVRLKELRGNMGIGHVRYSTEGASKIENSQPLLIGYKNGAIAIAHNGHLVNYRELRAELEAEGRIFITDSDTEVIAHLLVKELLVSDFVEAIRRLMQRIIGSYSLTLLFDGMVVAVRDPLGIKPLCIGKMDDGYIIASESAAIDTVGGTLLRDVCPGELVILKDGQIESRRICRSQNTAHCFFEFTYFARPDSIVDGLLVYDVRRRIGEILVEEHDVNADLVCPVPDSGVTFAIGYSIRSGIGYIEGLMKNRYIGRTFIMPAQEMRDIAVRLKLNAIRANVEGKRVALIDDSIVRGTTSKRIVDIIRSAGAKEIHMRIGCPPVISPCYFGIDMATRAELIAAHKSVDGIALMMGVDSLGYVSIDGLVKSIGISKENLCLGCITGRYPIEIPGEECIRKQLRLAQF
ncbi:MAG: amidophosphoribosyltransferase [Methanocellales archaeon]|nr:amidophosphoribosyltransferase [Methanocellales archaeon]